MPAKNALLYFDTVGESTSFSERRRSPRSLLDMPLVVRGLSAEKKPFQEETFTISVNAHGALIALSTRVAVGQALLLMDPQNWDERDGRVARCGTLDARLDQVCLEFTRPAPEFWRVGCPLRKT
jgi:hypothetical protein